jgi:hypothetical protein
VRTALQKRVADNARSLAVHGEPRKGVYLTGRVGGETISLHSEGDRVVLTGAQGVREEVDLKAPGRRASAGEEVPGTSVLGRRGARHQRARRCARGARGAGAADPERGR